MPLTRTCRSCSRFALTNIPQVCLCLSQIANRYTLNTWSVHIPTTSSLSLPDLDLILLQPERTIFSRLNDAAQQQNNSSQSSRMPGNISDKRQDRVNELLAEVHRIGQAKHADLLSASFVPNQYGATCRLTSLYLPLKLSLDRLKPPQSAALLRTQLLLPLIGFAATAEGAVDCSAKPFQDVRQQYVTW